MERTKQEGLNALVAKRIAEKLARGEDNANATIERLSNEAKISRDYLIDVGTKRKGEPFTVIDFKPLPKAKLGGVFSIKEGEKIVKKEFAINPYAIRQVADKLSIPGTYLTSLIMGSEWQQTLAYQILNTHNGWTDRNRIMIRTVGNEVRAFLSDQFRRLDSELIFGSHIKAVYDAGGQVSDGYMDDTSVMVESLLPTPIKIKTENNGEIWLAFGERIQTSDYGAGKLKLWQFIMQGVCLNGMVRNEVVKERHLGGRISESLKLSDETYRSDSTTTALAVRDLTKQLYADASIKERMLEIKAATDQIIDPSRELAELFRTGKLLKGEVESVGELLMKNSVRDGLFGEATLWKFTQALTAHANNETVAKTRALELQEIAGDLFNRIKN